MAMRCLAVLVLEPNEPLLRLGIGQVRDCRDSFDRVGGQLTRARDRVTKIGPEAGPASEAGPLFFFSEAGPVFFF